ncbi:MAG: type II toxin-antitoxin system PemK/MazF family toxin [Treponema sp.]|jgi:mRNA interferase MazF|nr:type II toxin-antitoxin system PemK/MazF family toxin [Treponema sp.]
MKRGDFYRVRRVSKLDPKEHRVYLIVSRQDFIETPFSTVICAPVYSRYRADITTQVEVGVDEGLKHDSAIYCDALISVQKSLLTDYVGALSDVKMDKVNTALREALATG